MTLVEAIVGTAALWSVVLWLLWLAYWRGY